ncbi:MAG: hypothetical protein ACHQ0Y_01530 [Thermodesulfovibrionales bacterium]
MQSNIREIERLLSVYRFWGLAAVAFFVLFLLSIFTVISSTGINYLLIAAPLFFGFLWIGTTSLSRHSLVQLKQSIDKEVGLLEFVSTQFVFALFPFTYRELKKEVALYESSCR